MSSEGEMFLIAVYVDDILLAGKSDKRMAKVKQAKGRPQLAFAVLHVTGSQLGAQVE